MEFGPKGLSGHGVRFGAHPRQKTPHYSPSSTPTSTYQTVSAGPGWEDQTETGQPLAGKRAMREEAVGEVGLEQVVEARVGEVEDGEEKEEEEEYEDGEEQEDEEVDEDEEVTVGS